MRTYLSRMAHEDLVSAACTYLNRRFPDPCWPFSSSGVENRHQQSFGVGGARTFDIAESGSDQGSCLEEFLISPNCAGYIPRPPCNH